MARRWTYAQILKADWKDRPYWIVGGVVVLGLLGGVFQWAGHSPWVAVIGIIAILAVALPIRERQIRRRLEEMERNERDGS
jgi:Flp pilus assembly protein TadB